jgi:hypothetical protein
LNKQLYDLHINNANTWGNVWLTISNNIDNELDDMMKVNNNINKKLEKLKDDNKIYTQRSNHVFHQRIENMSNMEFTSDEKTPLSKV